MAVSKKLVLNAAGDAATVADAQISDVFTTLFSMNEAVTGMMGLAQRAGLFAAGAAWQNNRLGNGFNFLR